MPNLQEGFLELIQNSFSDSFVRITKKWSDFLPENLQEKFIRYIHKEHKKILKDILEAGELYHSIKKK